jgi:hypothetical protein
VLELPALPIRSTHVDGKAVYSRGE